MSKSKRDIAKDMLQWIEDKMPDNFDFTHYHGEVNFKFKEGRIVKFNWNNEFIKEQPKV